jgi:hypothetical protein
MAAGPWGGHSNGYIPVEVLTTLSWPTGQQRLHQNAARDLEALNVAYQARFRANISVTDSYRDFAAQVRVKAEKGYLAATPGTSNHGWALAVDLGGGINTFGSDQYDWMKANAPSYRWIHPAWAEPNGSKPEAWHWEYDGPLDGTTPTNPTNPNPSEEDDMPLIITSPGRGAALLEGGRVVGLGDQASVGALQNAGVKNVGVTDADFARIATSPVGGTLLYANPGGWAYLAGHIGVGIGDQTTVDRLRNAGVPVLNVATADFQRLTGQG